MTKEESKAVRSRNLRYKKPALATMGYDHIITELSEISEVCDEVRYYDDADIDELTAALNGEEDEAYEFRMMFSDLSTSAERLSEELTSWDIRKEYDYCTVALIGNRYKSLGYDDYEEDYYSLTSFEQELAQTEAGKWLMRMTKAEMISTVGQCMGIALAFYDLRQKYDYLKATLDILRDENTSVISTVKAIEAAYNAATEAGYWGNTAEFDSLCAALPERCWVE